MSVVGQSQSHTVMRRLLQKRRKVSCRAEMIAVRECDVGRRQERDSIRGKRVCGKMSNVMGM